MRVARELVGEERNVAKQHEKNADEASECRLKSRVDRLAAAADTHRVCRWRAMRRLPHAARRDKREGDDDARRAAKCDDARQRAVKIAEQRPREDADEERGERGERSPKSPNAADEGRKIGDVRSTNERHVQLELARSLRPFIEGDGCNRCCVSASGAIAIGRSLPSSRKETEVKMRFCSGMRVLSVRRPSATTGNLQRAPPFGAASTHRDSRENERGTFAKAVGRQVCERDERRVNERHVSYARHFL